MKRHKNSDDLKGLHIKNSIESWMSNLVDMYDRKSMPEKNDTAITTEFTLLDEWNLFKRGNVLLIAGVCQASALCNSIALNVARESNANVTYFLTAGGKVQHAGMLLCADALVDASKLFGGFATEEMWPRVTDSAKKLADSNIYIDDRFSLSLDEIEKRLKEVSKDSDISLVIVEGLETLDRQNRKNMEDAWDLIGIRLKKMAKNFNCVVLLSQEIPIKYEENDMDFNFKKSHLTQLIAYKELIREIDVVMLTSMEPFRDRVTVSVFPNSSGISGEASLGYKKGCRRLFDPDKVP